MAKSKRAPSIGLRQAFLPVIAIGASAGGLGAIRSMLAKLPSDCGFALVVTQHLDSGQRSVLRGLRLKEIPFPVVEILNGISVQPNHVYVVPPNKKASISGVTLSLEPITSRDRRHPIDDFMVSLAAERGEASVGVVLSGKGSDGTRGLAAIKAAGGITFAQDPDTAQWPDMPRHAIQAGGVDFVLSPARIALELRRLGTANDRKHKLLQDQQIMTERQLRQRESELAALFDSSPDAHLRFDRSLRVTHANAAYGKLAGLSPREIVGKTGSELPLPQADVRVVNRLVKNVFRTGQPNQLELCVSVAEGMALHEIRYVPEFAPDGSVAAVLAIGRDITERKNMEQALRQREQALTALFDTSPDTHLRFDPVLRVTHANAAFGRVFGVSTQALIGKTVRELPLPQRNIQIGERLIKKVFQTGHPHQSDFSVLSPGGTIDHEVRFVPEVSPDGSVAAVLAIGRDITAQKRMEQALLQRDSELSALFGSSPDAYARFDSNLRVTHANVGFEQAMQASAQALIGTTVRQLPLSEDNRRTAEVLVKKVFRTGQSQRYEFSIISNEEVTEYEVRYVPELSTDGSVAAVLGVGRDITEQNRMERALRQREQELTTLFDNSPDSIVRRDRNLRNLYVNAAWEKLTGITREAALGKTSQELGKQPHLVRLQERAIRQVLKTRSPVTIEFTYQSPRGPVDQEVRCIPEFDESGVSSILLIGRDITEQKRLQTLASANERDIRALTANLLTAQEEERRRMARDIHDSLCQHLGALATEIGQVADKYAASSPAGQHLQAARERALSAAEEARQIARQLHPAILEDLGLRKALQHLCHEVDQQQDISVKLRVINPLPEVPLEAATCVYRIAQEALNNAARHAHAKHIWVRLSGTGNLRLSIHDDGIGFDPETVRGTGGLGMVSMEERARIADATLSVEGRKGRGTRLKLVVPIRGATREKAAHSAGR